MDFIIVKRESAEWLYMWLWLELEITEVEVWEYTGSYRQEGKTVHEFKHTSTHKLISLNASDTFTDKEIEKILKIK